MNNIETNKEINEMAPDENAAKKIAKEFSKQDVVRVTRFPTGLANYVYEAETADKNKFVIKMTKSENRNSLEAGLYWFNKLQPLGIPLPKVYDSDMNAQSPYIIMERLKGTDLANVYSQLSKEQKQDIAHEITKIQIKVASLPKGNGFGYANSYDSELKPSWKDVIKFLLNRSRIRTDTAGLIDPKYVDQVEDQLENFDEYFNNVEAECFLDDASTKNVIINNGKLEGIVDIDGVCFGDKILPLALTRTSLLTSGQDTDYVDFWAQALELNEDQQKVLNFYTAVYAVDFLSEEGQRFNKESSSPVNQERVSKLVVILDTALSNIP